MFNSKFYEYSKNIIKHRFLLKIIYYLLPVDWKYHNLENISIEQDVDDYDHTQIFRLMLLLDVKKFLMGGLGETSCINTFQDLTEMQKVQKLCQDWDNLSMPNLPKFVEMT